MRGVTRAGAGRRSCTCLPVLNLSGVDRVSALLLSEKGVVTPVRWSSSISLSFGSSYALMFRQENAVARRPKTRESSKDRHSLRRSTFAWARNPFYPAAFSACVRQLGAAALYAGLFRSRVVWPERALTRSGEPVRSEMTEAPEPEDKFRRHDTRRGERTRGRCAS
jgi:hypothetical protein